MFAWLNSKQLLIQKGNYYPTLPGLPLWLNFPGASFAFFCVFFFPYWVPVGLVGSVFDSFTIISFLYLGWASSDGCCSFARCAVRSRINSEGPTEHGDGLRLACCCLAWPRPKKNAQQGNEKTISDFFTGILQSCCGFCLFCCFIPILLFNKTLKGICFRGTKCL